MAWKPYAMHCIFDLLLISVAALSFVLWHTYFPSWGKNNLLSFNLILYINHKYPIYWYILHKLTAYISYIYIYCVYIYISYMQSLKKKYAWMSNFPTPFLAGCQGFPWLYAESQLEGVVVGKVVMVVMEVVVVCRACLCWGGGGLWGDGVG